MNVIEKISMLQKQVMNNEDMRREFLETRNSEQPFDTFCRKCREYGYEIYPMELVLAGEEFYATMKRSTNGGGENSPSLFGYDDFYEMFFAAIE